MRIRYLLISFLLFLNATSMAEQLVNPVPQQTKPVIQIKELEQIGMVVKNLDQSMKVMWENFGIGPWEVYIHQPERLREVKYYGKPSKSGLKVAIARLGAMHIELIEPIGKDNIYYDYLKKHGEGVQHLGWYKAETEEAFFSKTHELETAGFQCIFSGRTYRSRFAYFETTKKLHTILEVIWVDKNIPLQMSYKFPQNN